VTERWGRQQPEGYLRLKLIGGAFPDQSAQLPDDYSFESLRIRCIPIPVRKFQGEKVAAEYLIHGGNSIIDIAMVIS